MLPEETESDAGYSTTELWQINQTEPVSEGVESLQDDGNSESSPDAWKVALSISAIIIVSAFVCLCAIKCLFCKYKRSVVVRQPRGFLGEVTGRSENSDDAGITRNLSQMNQVMAPPQYSEIAEIQQRVCIEEEPPPSYDSIEVQKHIVTTSQPTPPISSKELPKMMDNVEN